MPFQVGVCRRCNDQFLPVGVQLGVSFPSASFFQSILEASQVLAVIEFCEINASTSEFRVHANRSTTEFSPAVIAILVGEAPVAPRFPTPNS